MSLIKISIFVKDPEEAIGFYRKAFGLRVSYQAPENNFYTVLSKGEEFFCSIVKEESKEAPGANPVQLGYSFQDQKELEACFEILKEGADVLMAPGPLPYCPCAAVLIDRYSVNWFLTIPPKGETPESWN